MPDTALNHESIAALVDRFYARVREDALLGPVFDTAIGDRWPEHLATLTDFWSSVLLASGRYKGNPMMTHLPIRQMDEQHLRRWLSLWRQTTTESFGPEIAAFLIERAAMVGERFVEVSTRVREAQPVVSS